jgi:hypothetical protein
VKEVEDAVEDGGTSPAAEQLTKERNTSGENKCESPCSDQHGCTQRSKIRSDRRRRHKSSSGAAYEAA